ncbi:MAG: ATP-binding protein [Spirochaetales bacterium]
MKFRGLQAKLTLMTLLLSVVPLLLLGVIAFGVSQNVLKTVNDRQVAIILEQERRFIRTVMGEVESLLANISGQDALKQFLNRPLGTMSDFDRLSTQARIGYILSGYINLKGLVSLDVFAPGGETFHVGDTLEQTQTRTQLVSELLTQAEAAPTAVFWSGLEDNIHSSSAFKKVVTAVKRLPTKIGNTAGESLLVVSYDPAVLNQTNRVGTRDFSIILDGKRRLVSHPDEALLGQIVPADILEHVVAGHSEFVYQNQAGTFDVVTLPIQGTEWLLLHFSSQDTLSGASWAIAGGMLAALLLALVAVFYLRRVISVQIVRPIGQISAGFQALQADGTAEPPRLATTSRDEIGTLISWYNVFLDSQTELKELNRTLEHRIETEVATSREKDSLIIQQGRQASMGEMIGNIAHQWRQPLNTTALLVQEMQLDFDDGKLDKATMDDFSSRLLTVIEAMSSTIDDFRDFFKPNREKVLFSVEHAVETALSFVGPAFKESSIDLVLTKDNPGQLQGYPNELSQVLLNILNNAKDAVAQAQPSRRVVRVCLSAEPGQQIITISDSGGGIPAKVLPKIFDPYFTTKAPGQGTGIGLFMSRTIVERNMGGRLLVSNITLDDQTAGAEFRLELPSHEAT